MGTGSKGPKKTFTGIANILHLDCVDDFPHLYIFQNCSLKLEAFYSKLYLDKSMKIN